MQQMSTNVEIQQRKPSAKTLFLPQKCTIFVAFTGAFLL